MCLFSIDNKFCCIELYFSVLCAHIMEQWGPSYDPHSHHFSAYFAEFLKGGNMAKQKPGH